MEMPKSSVKVPKSTSSDKPNKTEKNEAKRETKRSKSCKEKRSSRSSGGMSLFKFTGTSRPEEKVEDSSRREEEMKRLLFFDISEQSHKVSQGVHG